jgi:dolichol-phosphate mannosyltransferase
LNQSHADADDCQPAISAMIPNSSGSSRNARSVSVVIPCLNEMEVLGTLYDRLQAEVQQWADDYEVILIDDGSTDQTWSIIQSIHARNPRWKGIRLGRNFGHQLALRAGLQATTGDVVAVLDADLQDPPKVAGQMIDQWRDGFDVVVGVRRQRKEGPLKRSLYFSFYRLLSLIAELDLPLDAGDFCVMDRSVVDVIMQMHESRPFIRGLRSWVGFKQALFPYERAARQAGQTKYSYWKLMKLAADGILSNSRMPLHFATVFGAIVSVAAFLGAVLTLAIRMAPATFKRWGVEYVPGTASVIISLLFIGGVQLLCLGIIGAYVGRIHENVMRRPLWSVRQTLGIDPKRLTETS